MMRRVFLWASAAAALLPAAQAQTARFIALRHWVSPEYTRLALEFDGVMLVDERVEEAASANPVHEVELVGVAYIPALLSALVQTYPSQAHSLLKQTKLAPSPNGVRLQLMLTQAARLEMTTVSASGAYRQRLLIDIYPAKTDSIAQWLAQQNVTKPAATPAPQPQPSTSVTTKKATTKTLVIDAGHGGEDPGAIGPTGVKEKDITLALALQLSARVQSSLGWRVVLTRDGDYFVPLAQRVSRARAAKADVFLSIHADAFFTPKARGASVYALSEKGASSAAARWMASKENEADGVGGLNISHRDKQVASVMLDLSTASQIRSSVKLGGKLIAQLGGVGHMHKKQVEQAGFAVLKAPDIPSLLIETAFISHPEEEQLLANAAYQSKLVAALTRGLKGFAST
jgi:N-acetylmuramoyl-L-alanine amidase